MTISEKIRAAYAAAKNYPDLAAKLLEAGVLSYTVDTSSSLIIYRLRGGLIHFGGHASEPLTIAHKFNEELTIKAIRDNQQGQTTTRNLCRELPTQVYAFTKPRLKQLSPWLPILGSAVFTKKKFR